MPINVQHPTPGYTGTATINGHSLTFKDGKAEAKSDARLTGFRRAGYKLSRPGKTTQKPAADTKTASK